MQDDTLDSGDRNPALSIADTEGSIEMQNVKRMFNGFLEGCCIGPNPTDCSTGRFPVSPSLITGWWKRQKRFPLVQYRAQFHKVAEQENIA